MYRPLRLQSRRRHARVSAGASGGFHAESQRRARGYRCRCATSCTQGSNSHCGVALFEQLGTRSGRFLRDGSKDVGRTSRRRPRALRHTASHGWKPIASCERSHPPKHSGVRGARTGCGPASGPPHCGCHVLVHENAFGHPSKFGYPSKFGHPSKFGYPSKFGHPSAETAANNKYQSG